MGGALPIRIQNKRRGHTRMKKNKTQKPNQMRSDKIKSPPHTITASINVFKYELTRVNKKNT